MEHMGLSLTQQNQARGSHRQDMRRPGDANVSWVKSVSRDEPVQESGQFSFFDGLLFFSPEIVIIFELNETNTKYDSGKPNFSMNLFYFSKP